MVRSYDKLGLNDLRDDAARVFAKNFPDSKLPAGGGGEVDAPWWKFW